MGGQKLSVPMSHNNGSHSVCTVPRRALSKSAEWCLPVPIGRIAVPCYLLQASHLGHPDWELPHCDPFRRVFCLGFFCFQKLMKGSQRQMPAVGVFICSFGVRIEDLLMLDTPSHTEAPGGGTCSAPRLLPRPEALLCITQVLSILLNVPPKENEPQPQASLRWSRPKRNRLKAHPDPVHHRWPTRISLSAAQ
jgi:hypothetical protein